MNYSVAVSKLKVLLMALTGLAVIPLAYFLLNVLMELEIFGRNVLLLYILLSVLIIVGALVFIAAIALLIRFPGKYIEMDSISFTAKFPILSTVSIPWSEIEKIGFAGDGRNKSLVITLHHPEKYIPQLEGLKKSALNATTNLRGTPFVLSLRFLNQQPEAVYEKALEFWNRYDLDQAASAESR